jgi:hypothetical protein
MYSSRDNRRDKENGASTFRKGQVELHNDMSFMRIGNIIIIVIIKICYCQLRQEIWLLQHTAMEVRGLKLTVENSSILASFHCSFEA